MTDIKHRCIATQGQDAWICSLCGRVLEGFISSKPDFKHDHFFNDNGFGTVIGDCRTGRNSHLKQTHILSNQSNGKHDQRIHDHIIASTALAERYLKQINPLGDISSDTVFENLQLIWKWLSEMPKHRKGFQGQRLLILYATTGLIALNLANKPILSKAYMHMLFPVFLAKLTSRKNDIQDIVRAPEVRDHPNTLQAAEVKKMYRTFFNSYTKVCTDLKSHGRARGYPNMSFNQQTLAKPGYEDIKILTPLLLNIINPENRKYLETLSRVLGDWVANNPTRNKNYTTNTLAVAFIVLGAPTLDVYHVWLEKFKQYPWLHVNYMQLEKVLIKDCLARRPDIKEWAYVHRERLQIDENTARLILDQFVRPPHII